MMPILKVPFKKKENPGGVIKSGPAFIPENLRPIVGIFQGSDYSTANSIEICKPAIDAWIIVPETPFFPKSSINIKNISDIAKEYKPESFQEAVRNFLNPEHRSTHLHLLRLSPYWISALSEREKIFGHKQGKFRNLLILYRLVEICLAAIQALENDREGLASQLQISACLLMRQRYLYLAQLDALLEDDENISNYVPGYIFHIRQAREAYASLLLDEDPSLRRAAPGIPRRDEKDIHGRDLSRSLKKPAICSISLCRLKA